jgi:hypothetical protein
MSLELGDNTSHFGRGCYGVPISYNFFRKLPYGSNGSLFGSTPQRKLLERHGDDIASQKKL